MISEHWKYSIANWVNIRYSEVLLDISLPLLHLILSGIHLYEQLSQLYLRNITVIEIMNEVT